MTTKSKICPGCGKSFPVLWSSKFGCKNCTAKAKKWKAPAARSKKEIKKQTEYTPIRKAFIIDHEGCEAGLSECTYIATEIHHRMQIRYGYALNDVDQFVAVCSACHKEIHANPEEAISRNLLASRSEKAAYVKKIIDKKFE